MTMSSAPDLPPLAQARRIADTLLYEGYLLYPYRDTADKNRQRFQFGVLMPPAYVRADPSEHTDNQTECLVECAPGAGAAVRILVRFLHIQRRTGPDGQTWDEAVEHERRFLVHADDLIDGDVLPVSADECEFDEPTADGAGVLRRRRAKLQGILGIRAERLPGTRHILRLRIRLENQTATDPAPGTRQDALPHAFVAAHSLLEVVGGSFLSLLEPPPWAAAHASACQNLRTWPVLAGAPGSRTVLLSAPIILYDYPQLAPESFGPLYDLTEIDELLALRTLSLTEDEKTRARATDARAAAIIDQVESMRPERFARLHGAARPTHAAARPDGGPAPEAERVVVDGVELAPGSRVVMRPGARRADAQDMFLAGRPGIVEAVLRDADGNVHLAVTPEDDPAAELRRWHGSFLYFAPAEVEPAGRPE